MTPDMFCLLNIEIKLMEYVGIEYRLQIIKNLIDNRQEFVKTDMFKYLST